MKKKISGILIVILSITLCFGCGSDKKEKATESIVASSLQDDSTNESLEEITTEKRDDGTIDNTSEQETSLVEDITTSKDVVENETTTKKQDTTKKQETTTLKKEESTTKKQETATTCNHSYMDATCMVPAKCSKCGATKGDKLEHNMSQGKCKICGQEMECLGSFDVSQKQDKSIMAYIYVMQEDVYQLSIRGTGDMKDFGLSNTPYNPLLDKIKFVEIEEGITSIGDYSFFSWGGIYLEELKLPSTLKEIGVSAFESVQFVGNNVLKLPSSLKIINDNAFECATIGNLVIPNSVEIIGYRAFYGAGIYELSLSSNIKKLGESAFSNFDDEFINLRMDGVIAYGNGYYIGNDKNPYLMLVGVAKKEIKSLEIHPNTKIIYDKVAAECLFLKEVLIPNSVTIIGDDAFSYCESLEKVEIGTGLQYLNGYAFYDCPKLESINLAKSIVYIGKCNFSFCYAFEEIRYAGTKSDWEKIEFEQYWEYLELEGSWKKLNLTIKCTDGDIVIQ